MTKPLLVFDLDGTLLETAPDLVGTLNEILTEQGLQPIPLATAKTFIGQGAKMMIENGFAANNDTVSADRLDGLMTSFLQKYEARIARETYPFPGLLDALDRLQQEGWALAVCTNKHERLARLLLEELGLTGRFVVITGGDTFDHKKPHPEHLLKTVELAGAKVDQSIMIGDSSSDINAAKAASIPVIAVDFGYTPVPVSELGPDLIISHFDQIHDAIKTISGR
ncbi:UNVERIFIED_CONTAM: hypothetical protein GTU68_063096 [Idotea baltica]|nr:hypothetical protein [Idotea baltica]